MSKINGTNVYLKNWKENQIKQEEVESKIQKKTQNLKRHNGNTKGKDEI